MAADLLLSTPMSKSCFLDNSFNNKLCNLDNCYYSMHDLVQHCVQRAKHNNLKKAHSKEPIGTLSS